MKFIYLLIVASLLSPAFAHPPEEPSINLEYDHTHSHSKEGIH